MFTDRQKYQLKKTGIPESEILRQLNRFKTGMIYADLDKPATAGDGILVFDKDQQKEAANDFLRYSGGYKIVKFVPASGAASRMFKDLFEFSGTDNSGEITLPTISPPVEKFATGIREMPFFDELSSKVEERFPGILFSTEPSIIKLFIDTLLTEQGMNYGTLPKALLKFHRYGDQTRMSFEEHLVEWALMNPGTKQKLFIHFTLSPNHLDLFYKALSIRLPLYENRFKREFDISTSVQEPITDTIAVTPDNLPFTDSEGNLVFRPGGHGALLYNLNNINADIVFIKNIDNIAVEEIEIRNIIWKQILGGVLIGIRQKIFEILSALEIGSETVIPDAIEWIKKTFGYSIIADSQDIKKSVIEYLNRPVRICGMVKNTGEPGGGPFWVKDKYGISLQIIESAQIDMNNRIQKEIALSATHFNPVDLVCSITDYKNEKFNLNSFSDHDTSFISEKSYQGKKLKALEHPGLWNGAMARWLTLFIEVPLITFNPVKTVNDLLRTEHQVKNSN